MSAYPIAESVEPSGIVQASKLLICLPSLPVEALQMMMATISEAFPGEEVTIASSDAGSQNSASTNSVRIVGYSHPRPQFEWVLAAGDYVAAAELLQAQDASAVILLGDLEISADLLRSLFTELREKHTDLVLPRYHTGPTEGLVTAALFYPLTRVLFGVDVRFPLPFNVAMSRRAAEQLAPAARALANHPFLDSLLWPVPITAVSGLSIRQVEAGERSLPQPSEADFNLLFTGIAGSLFLDIESKANFWQRARASTPPSGAKPKSESTPEVDIEELRPMVESFRLAYANLQEIWALVLPPQSLLALKRLSTAAPEDFNIAPQLWARIVYDFILAFHLRTIHRGHLLGALTSIYLAWVSSYLRCCGHSRAASVAHIEETAAAFEREKTYLISRWRWPDRFNP